MDLLAELKVAHAGQHPASDDQGAEAYQVFSVSVRAPTSGPEGLEHLSGEVLGADIPR